MAVRTNDMLIGQLLDIVITVITNSTQFIQTANTLVTKFCSTDNYTVAELTQIETWLAAHFISVKQKIAREEKVDELTDRFEGVTKMHLQSSLYGQTAMTLDWAGGLSTWNLQAIKGSKRTAGFTYVGKTRDEYLFGT